LVNNMLNLLNNLAEDYKDYIKIKIW
jgi:uncharacterized protein YsxB (DUF464 family)